MNVSSTLTSLYAAKTSAAAGNIYASLAASGSAGNKAPAKTSVSPDAIVTISSKALELMQRRQVSNDEVQQLKEILAKANAANAQSDPKSFLRGLSAADMEVLRKVHSLADAIDIPSLSQEGAANLLVPPGSARDLDNNGLTSVGAGNFFTFPPENAPESFKAAWASASENMSFADIPTEMIFAVGLANIHVDERSGRVTSVSPDDPNWRNPYADPGYDYRGAIDNITSSLKYNYEHNLIPKERYEQEMAFYTRVTKAMG